MLLLQRRATGDLIYNRRASSIVQFQVVLEHDAESGHYTASVPSIPEIIVDAETEAEALEMAREAIAFWRDETPATSSMQVQAKIATVEA